MRPLPLLLATCLLAAADPPASAPGADPAFECRPGRLGMTRYRNWQNDGKRTNDNRDFQVGLRFFTKGNVTVVGWKDVVVTQAISDAGEAVEINRQGGFSREGRMDMDRRRMREGDDPAFEIDLNFAWPSKPCNGLSKITGTVTAQIATGAPKKAELKPFKDVLGKVLEIAGIPGGEVSVDKPDGGDGVTLRYPNTLQDKILGVTFLDGAGRELRMNGWGGGSNNNEVERNYHLKMPDDGVIVISIAPESKSVVVPFTVEGVTMDATTGKGAKERVKVQAVDDVPAPPAKGKEKDPNLLPVKPVEDKAKF